MDYKVTAERNGRIEIFNKKPLSKKEAEKMMADLKKATIPSVDLKTMSIEHSI